MNNEDLLSIHCYPKPGHHALKNQIRIRVTPQKVAISGCHTQQNSVAFICKGKFSCKIGPKQAIKF